MVSDFNENWYLGVFWSEELVGNDEICIQGHFYEATIFKMAATKIVKLSMVSDFNENWYLCYFEVRNWLVMMKIAFRVIFIIKMAANIIGKISVFSNFNENWYLGLFWSEELIGNDENCIQGPLFDATVSEMAANKIEKLLMNSDFNEN
jgi:hypothetical protein